jgi:ubiquinone/menaquinone biosynthesis C-methylase UbiE
MTQDAASLAQGHWNETPLFYSAEERYRIYPWLPKAAEFAGHAGEMVLEVGCGTGCDLLQFALNGASAHGIDITEEHLRLAKQRVGDRAVVKYGDGRNIPYPDNHFDYVYSHGVLMVSDQPQKMVSEILRVLKPGGTFNIHVYAKWSYFTALWILRFGRDWKNHIENSTTPVHIDLYTARKLRQLFPVRLRISKHQALPHEIFAPLWGWYLIARGTKPDARLNHGF